jgi:hypothetical protein
VACPIRGGRPPHYVLGEGGKPVPEPDALAFAAWFETADRVVARTETNNGTVSTVFLGFDHNFGDDGPPVLWETMVFGGDRAGYQERYASREAALAGHDWIVRAVEHGGT